MKTVKVTFHMEVTDPDHEMGLTNDDYEDVMLRLSPLADGEHDINIELVEEDDES